MTVLRVIYCAVYVTIAAMLLVAVTMAFAVTIVVAGKDALP